jgi:hypothetical protein
MLFSIIILFIGVDRIYNVINFIIGLRVRVHLVKLILVWIVKLVGILIIIVNLLVGH